MQIVKYIKLHIICSSTISLGPKQDEFQENKNM